MTNASAPDQPLSVASRDEPDAPALGPKATLRELFDMHAPYVWNTLRRLGVAKPDLEDVTHDVFVQVQRHIGEYDATRSGRAWLFGFAFRVASAHRRRAFRRYETSAGQGAEAVDPAKPADEQMVDGQDRQLVLDALEAIEIDRRAVFVLSQIDGVPMSEVAQSLGVPVNTAYSRLRAARVEFAAAVKRLRAQRGER
jgi:RNA polymerase sigma-70 factor (ECF subfamily)